MEVNLIVAVGNEGEIGRKGDLIWKIPADLKRFKALTTGHPVIMGRKTWESLPKRPLPNRHNIVLTRRQNYRAEGADTATDIRQALEMCGETSPFIIGGSEIYNLFLPLTTRLYLTEVDDKCDDADAFLHIDLSDWEKIEESEKQTTEDGIIYRYVTYRRISSENNHHQ